MKKMMLASILLLFFSQNGISQTEPRLIQYNRSTFDAQTNKYNLREEEKYEHDDFGNVILLEKINYQSNGEVDLWRGLFYDYNEQQQLKKLRYRQYKETVDLWITDFWFEYEYDDNGCLTERSTIYNTGGGGVKNKIEYVRDEACRMISTTAMNRSNIDQPFKIFSYETRDYHADGISYDGLEYNLKTTGDSLYLKYKDDFIFNEAGNVLQRNRTIFSEGNGAYNFSKSNYEYDNSENLIYSKGFHKSQDTAEWILFAELNYYLAYDENGFLIENRKEYISHDTGAPIVNSDFGKTLFFKNSCEGIQEEINSIYDAGSNIKEEYLYKGINGCLDLEKIDLDISVFPNPSDGFLEISSPIFKAGNTEILVYSIDGKVLLQKSEDSRSSTTSLDLSFLQNGFYILQLRNGKHFVKEKIVIAK